MTLTIGSLFSGYGGLDLAVEHAFNATTAWHCEWEDAPSKILATHWSGVPNYRDVTQVDWSETPPVDIITGGFPCQDVSLAGRRAGMTDGTRSNLWGAMRTAIETIKPRYVVAENVRGLLSAKADSELEPCPGCMGDRGGDGEHVLRALGRVLGDLADLRYDAQWHGLRASDVGAPHQRFRVFILATRRGPSANSSGERSREGMGGQAGVAGAEVSQPHHRGATTAHSGSEVGDQRAGLRQGEPAGIGRERPDNSGSPTPHTAGIGRTSRRPEPAGIKRRSNAPECGTPATPDPNGAGGEAHRRRQGARDAGRREPLVSGGTSGEGTDWGPYASAIHRWERLRGPAPAPTELTAKGKHRLSSRFAEWMMGLPAGWVTDIDISRNDQLKAIGNGVVPQQAAAALDHMLNNERRDAA